MWTPHAGPQTAFLASVEDEVLYGGAAGGGKSDALLFGGLIPMQVSTGVSLIMRRTFPELSELIERARRVFEPFGAKWNGSEKVFRFPNGALYYFGYGSTLAEMQQYIGKEYAYIGFDEIGLLADERAWELLLTRLRVKDSRLRPMARASANPGGPAQAWLRRRFIGPCDYGKRVHTFTDAESGQTLTRRFIPARVSDNPTLMKNNPKYIARLRSLTEAQRRQLLDGDWDASAGSYFSELTRDLHIVDPFAVPRSWGRWGAFDWGYAHPAVFGSFAMDHEGNAYLLDSVHMHRKTDHQQAERILACPAVTDDTRHEVHAGHDCWDQIRARGSQVPSTAETFFEHDLWLTKANISRVPGWRNVREYLTTKRGGEADGDEIHTPPKFYLVETPGNLLTFETLQGLVTDERDPEDVLKVDANGTTGVGGDDAADMVRYGLGARIYVRDPVQSIDTSSHIGRDMTPDHDIYGTDDPDDGSFAGLPAGY